jgi:thioesterase domain-containing protein
MTSLTDELERVWHTRIPISAAMDIRIDSYHDDTLEVRAALAPNVNVHGTAFAGSLYAVAALTGWGITWLALRERGFEGDIVIAEANIRYASPVAQDFVARCAFDAARHAPPFARLAAEGRCRFALDVAILAGDVTAATFSGQYAVRQPHGTRSHTPIDVR